MSSIRDGNVDVTNGSTTVTGNNTTWVDDGVSAGDLFVVSGDVVSYEVASVTNNTELELTGSYQGDTADSVNYSIHTSFTPNKKYPFPETGDFETATIVKKAIKQIDDDNYLTGPANSTDNALALFDGTGGGTIQDSGVLVSDDDELYGHGQRIDFKTSDFTLAAEDAGKNLDVATATVTIPNDSNVSLPVGYSVGIVQADSNAVTVSGESDVTIQSKDGNTSTNGQWSAATLYKRDTDEWVLIGDLA